MEGGIEDEEGPGGRGGGLLLVPTDLDLNPNSSKSSYLNHSYTYSNDSSGGQGYGGTFELINHPGVQAIFYVIYANIFILGIFGNVLVCFVVGRNKAMQTVTNFFITNLALADILLCALAVPFTPLYTFLQEWVFGRVLCHLVPYAQGTSVYISTLTLTSIAIDRFFVIIYPFKPRMKLTVCLSIITGIWIFALVATLPYGIFLEYKTENGRWICLETWPSSRERNVFSACTTSLQFILPFMIILFCYVKVSLKLKDRAKAKPGEKVKNSKKEALERERKRRTNRMLIAMVMIFGICWLPINLFNLLADVYPEGENWEHYQLCFFITHAIAMSSCCYNPWLYAWLNENFRKEFKQVLPCFSLPGGGAGGGRGGGGGSVMRGGIGSTRRSLPGPSSSISNRRSGNPPTNNPNPTQQQPPPTCNGGEQSITTTTTTVLIGGGGGSGGDNPDGTKILETIEEGTTTSQSQSLGGGVGGVSAGGVATLMNVSASFHSSTNLVQIHLPQKPPTEEEVEEVIPE